MDCHVVVGCHAAVGYRVGEPTRTVAVALFRFLLTPSHFHYPMGLTAWHMLFGSVISFFLCRVFKVRRQHEPEAISHASVVASTRANTMQVVPTLNMDGSTYLRCVVPGARIYRGCVSLRASAAATAQLTLAPPPPSQP